MQKIKNKRGQVQGGLVTSLVFGIASLIIGVIVAFVIVNTLGDADLLTGGRTDTTVNNETGSADTTGYTLSVVSNNIVSGSYSVSAAINGTSGAVVNVAGNISVSSAGVVTNASAVEWTSVNMTYSYTTKSDEELSADRLRANFTEGIDNVSSKIPTVLLISAVVLIMGALVLLVGVWQRMRLGGGSL